MLFKPWLAFLNHPFSWVSNQNTLLLYHFMSLPNLAKCEKHPIVRCLTVSNDFGESFCPMPKTKEVPECPAILPASKQSLPTFREEENRDLPRILWEFLSNWPFSTFPKPFNGQNSWVFADVRGLERQTFSPDNLNATCNQPSRFITKKCEKSWCLAQLEFELLILSSKDGKLKSNEHFCMCDVGFERLIHGRNPFFPKNLAGILFWKL